MPAASRPSPWPNNCAARRSGAATPTASAIACRGPPVDLLAFLISRCPEPAEEYCRCPAHATLNRRDLRNQWNILHSFAPFPGFAVPPAAGKGHTGFAYAPLEWTRNGEVYRAAVDGREWQLHSLAPDVSHYELSIGDALAIEFDTWPPFWRVKEREPGGGETKRS